MSKINKTLIFLVIILLAIIFMAEQWNINKKESSNQSKVLPATTQVENIQVKLLIDGFISTEQLIELRDGSTVFSVLELINQQNPALNLDFETYENLGVLIKQLGDKVNGQDNKYWQYYINGQQLMMAADQYILKNNDKIEWLFQESQF